MPSADFQPDIPPDTFPVYLSGEYGTDWLFGRYNRLLRYVKYDLTLALRNTQGDATYNDEAPPMPVGYGVTSITLTPVVKDAPGLEPQEPGTEAPMAVSSDLDDTSEPRQAKNAHSSPTCPARTIEHGNFSWVNNQVLDDRRLKAIDRSVYMTLARHANNETQECHLLLNTIAKESGCCRESVKRAIRKMVALGMIHQKYNFRDGEYISSSFKLLHYFEPTSAPTDPTSAPTDPTSALTEPYNNTPSTKLSNKTSFSRQLKPESEREKVASLDGKTVTPAEKDTSSDTSILRANDRTTDTSGQHTSSTMPKRIEPSNGSQGNTSTAGQHKLRTGTQVQASEMTLLPENFRPTDDDRKWFNDEAVRRGVKRLFILNDSLRQANSAFILWKQDKGELSHNWSSAWRLWMDKALDNAIKANPHCLSRDSGSTRPTPGNPSGVVI